MRCNMEHPDRSIRQMSDELEALRHERVASPRACSARGARAAREPLRALIHGSDATGPLSRRGETTIHTSVEDAPAASRGFHNVLDCGVCSRKHRWCRDTCDIHGARCACCCGAGRLRDDRSAFSADAAERPEASNAKEVCATVSRAADGIPLGLGRGSHRNHVSVVGSFLVGTPPNVRRLGSLVGRNRVCHRLLCPSWLSGSDLRSKPRFYAQLRPAEEVYRLPCAAVGPSRQPHPIYVSADGEHWNRSRARKRFVIARPRLAAILGAPLSATGMEE